MASTVWVKNAKNEVEETTTDVAARLIANGWEEIEPPNYKGTQRCGGCLSSKSKTSLFQAAKNGWVYEEHFD